MLIKNPTNKELKYAIDELKKGNLIVYPTDTIYGIAANIEKEDAIKKVYETKKRLRNKPLSVCVHDIEQIKQLAYVNDKIEDIIDILLPGSYTLLLKKLDTTSNLLTAKTDKIGIRIPDSSITNYLTKEFSITTTSANISEEKTPDNIFMIQEQLKDNISLYINIGTIKHNMPSTIIDLTRNKPLIIRKGQYNKQLLEKIIKMKLY